MEENEKWSTVNLKLPNGMKNDFKKAARKNGGTMQSVLFSMSADYVENADHLKFKLIDSRGGTMTENETNGMMSYHLEVASKGSITYGEMEFKSFSVREVYVNGKQKGEYHIKPLVGKSASKAILFLRQFFPDCSIGLADPSGLLSLEHPIYLVCKNNLMIMDTISQTFEHIDGVIGDR